ncbi:uncharacterized protein Z518_00239 [Rhinocladiella mackenziei CBS 650.93]|uniref:Alpha/beta hydrolase fold-3 domain-containing protein n=1 Tax=Rhinocladiella mackenziei CBS 650.93 TaxID=1442369 RepID=A0A0D2J0H7_9EURO|nr:uncharacterized protein Z518_00239 [Rhinocladiella mackenziei CBS 650.93]KIX09161.1 hypothetical protein Z518_00239 [Rhinocladiella mackenziei CBS 650.93]
MLYYLFPRNRPHPSYSWHQATANTVIRWFLEFIAHIRPVSRQDVGVDAQNQSNVVVIPISSEPIYETPLDDDKSIRPSKILGTWYPQPPLDTTGKPNTSIVLHFHGGGYVIGSSKPADYGYMAIKLTEYLAPYVLLPEYRLACTSRGRFPAALQDAVSTYQYLFDLGYRQDDIILSGDSAGGNLALGLLRYLAEHSHLDLPAPRRTFLWSPWVDVARSQNTATIGQNPNYHTDYIPATFVEWAANSFAPPGEVNVNSRYISFTGRPFRTESTLWIHAGALELMYSEIVEFVSLMKNEKNIVHFHTSPKAYHDIVETGYINGFKDEIREVLKMAQESLKPSKPGSS